MSNWDIVVGTIRTVEDREVLESVKELWMTGEMLKEATTDHKVLLDRSMEERLPEGLRSVFRKEAEKWDKEVIPSLVRRFEEMPGIHPKARGLMFSGAEYVSRARAELAATDLKIEMLERASKDPRTRKSGELAVVNMLEAALREKGETENEAFRRLRNAGGASLAMALVKYTVINAKDEMKTMTAVRRDLEALGPAARMLTEVEDAFVRVWESVSTGASRDPEFTKDFQVWLRQSADEAREYHRPKGGSHDETVIIALGNPTTPEEMIANQKEAVARLKEEVLDPQVGKERRQLLIMWIEGMENTISKQEDQLEAFKGDPKESQNALWTGDRGEMG